MIRFGNPTIVGARSFEVTIGRDSGCGMRWVDSDGNGHDFVGRTFALGEPYVVLTTPAGALPERLWRRLEHWARPRGVEDRRADP